MQQLQPYKVWDQNRVCFLTSKWVQKPKPMKTYPFALAIHDGMVEIQNFQFFSCLQQFEILLIFQMPLEAMFLVQCFKNRYSWSWGHQRSNVRPKKVWVVIRKFRREMAKFKCSEALPRTLRSKISNFYIITLTFYGFILSIAVKN